MRDNLIATGSGGKFTRPASEFTGMVEPPGSDGAKHVAEAGRYHLFVSGVCPWLTLTLTLALTQTLSLSLTLSLTLSLSLSPTLTLSLTLSLSLTVSLTLSPTLNPNPNP